ncbi:MAG: VCBS repeat-containing protein [Acidobacteriota bacterium]|nr:VCBS repeat-containing protein [Acidobacteriota bacterium]
MRDTATEDVKTYRDANATVLPTPGFFTALGRGQVVSASVHDFSGDGRPDILLGGYRFGSWVRGVQVLVNAGNRTFLNETLHRLGPSAWSATESWHVGHRFFDFNGDGSVDIAPQWYGVGAHVMAWLNDGTGRYAALKTTRFSDADAVLPFAHGVVVRAGNAFKYMEFLGDGVRLHANAGVVVEGATVRRPTP